MENYGLVIVGKNVSEIFLVDENGEGGGYIVPAPGVKLVRWSRIYIHDDLRVYHHPTWDFYAVWSNDKETLELIRQIVLEHPGQTLRELLE